MNRRHFETGGDAYARYRPAYPSELATLLASLAPRRDLAVDVGCGNGQLAVRLAGHFDCIHACDISVDQVANALAHPGVCYSVAPAHALPVADASAALVSVAQAAHWFELDGFYAEVRRIAQPGAPVALITYMNPVVEGPLGEYFEAFYTRDLGPFWPPERRLIERGYSDLPFPFDELPAPAMTIECDWTLPALLGYVETWSATKRARAAGQGACVDAFIGEAGRLWGDAGLARRVTWPIRMRIGRA
jgi:SAM-dependent methyltransferase